MARSAASTHSRPRRRSLPLKQACFKIAAVDAYDLDDFYLARPRCIIL